MCTGVVPCTIYTLYKPKSASNTKLQRLTQNTWTCAEVLIAPTSSSYFFESSLTLLRRLLLFQVVMIISLAAAPAETMGLALIAFVLAGLRAMFAGDEC